MAFVPLLSHVRFYSEEVGNHSFRYWDIVATDGSSSAWVDSSSCHSSSSTVDSWYWIGEKRYSQLGCKRSPGWSIPVDIRHWQVGETLGRRMVKNKRNLHKIHCIALSCTQKVIICQFRWNCRSTPTLRKFHLIHPFIFVPMQEGLSLVHCHKLRHGPLKQFLDRGLSCICQQICELIEESSHSVC